MYVQAVAGAETEAEAGLGSLLGAMVANLEGSVSPGKLRKAREILLRKYATTQLQISFHVILGSCRA